MLKLQQIDGIEKLKADVPLYYLTNYQGKACFVDEHENKTKIAISFTLEMEASGTKRVEVQFAGDVNYPLLPLIKMLKTEISKLDEAGKLPW